MYRPPSRAQGMTCVEFIGGHEFCLDRQDFEALLKAWKDGYDFFDGIDLYGDRVTLSLRSVTNVQEVTPVGLERYYQEIEEHERENLLKGNL